MNDNLLPIATKLERIKSNFKQYAKTNAERYDVPECIVVSCIELVAYELMKQDYSDICNALSFDLENDMEKENGNPE